MDADLDLLLIAVYVTADDLLPEKPGNAKRSVTDAARDAARRPSAVLDGFQANAMDDEVAIEEGVYGQLSSQELRWVADPGSHPLLDTCSRYPLTLSELHLLSGADERRLEGWTRERLIPTHPTGDRRDYFSAGVARALRLAQADRLRLRPAP
jgi:hypothetical protein